MRTDDFAYDLPPELIAQEPAEPRDAARLMVLDRAAQRIDHRIVRDLPGLLRPGDLLVVNDTRVMAARLFGRRADTGGTVEILLVRPFTDTRWEVLMKPARRAAEGRRFVFDTHESELEAVCAGRNGETVVLEFARPFDPARVGEVPLPPYITQFRGDPERYQTVYSREARSAAAPTAGLHFTPELLARLEAAGIERTAVTLEVGPGTFKPVNVDDPREFDLHAEHITVPEEAAVRVQRARAEGRRVVAVGTTVVRTLEHVARECGEVVPYAGWTSLKILPGDEFRAVDVLMTNFHLPKSTLLMLVCAFAGYDFVMAAYREAVRERYRFYSFGDAMLIL
ncbi:tRNA preQ1(34) S-adenosylmethionine ribosyltransferase-isomerase QueA [Tepidiforma sp.]|uniref:tRNA preQ1(34) S-adenosylmethionine ribosyltransferase-isomerase QueA n=1 Tax=Tepidiforma sp. TaxID=2682230 RepID=UPI0021DB92DE|nr:tRNA preQ1(34) S-adenosylmethionine ribosyltransferase-isomerase QueA [Tepidiforma sp.]MCX7618027.1 tRNA preQ1(34) S-adenosylmethionine ribosyltransferase-isomerase QueA [Tepidiforma sp.]GIW16889.1 MAG: S-adenosylmethionine:tRNA ribosyltransferase-isomerase [Tepidiforma sp.]